MEQLIRDINPELDVKAFKNGVSLEDLDAFLDGVDIYVDRLDIFAIEIRRVLLLQS